MEKRSAFRMKGKVKLGIVAAMEREIKPLVRGWRVVDVPGSAARAFVGEDAVLMCAGIGEAGPTTRCLIESFDPEVVISAGFAGALCEELQVPDVLVPSRVLDEGTTAEYWTGAGSGTLITAARIASVKAKRELAKSYGAQAVDMEASQVAKVAEVAGRRFLAIKVISDKVGSDISFVSDFVEDTGFNTAGFLAHVAVRPGLWRAVGNLGVNSNRAQRALCAYLKFIIQNTSQLDNALKSASFHGAITPAK